MTAFYIFRALFITFEGEFRGGAEADPEAPANGAGVHLAESPALMVWPMVLLGAAAVLTGFFVNPTTGLAIVPIHWFTHFLGQGPVLVETESFDIPLAAGSSLMAASGIVLAYLMYQLKCISPQRMAERLKPAYNLLSRKYYFDEAYEGHLVTRFLNGGLARALDWADKSIIDRLVNTIGWVGANTGSALRQVQTGQLQGYGMAISVGILIMLGLYLFFL